ncbi:MAG TPA: ATP-binding protein [Burkholderiales bacterium]|nr:ATP-binding protein [Burkholderiales bacterium]
MATLAYGPLFAPDAHPPESFWISLRYFNLYRIVVALLFLGATYIAYEPINFGAHDVGLFRAVCVAYLILAIGLQFMLRAVQDRFNLQLSVHVLLDVVTFPLLMYASGGIRSGLGVMLLISLIGAGLVAPRRLNFLYAALAAIAVLLEESYWVLALDLPSASVVPAALLSMGYFATAGATGWLAQRLAANERLARERGRALANQTRVNQLVIADMQDGVLLLDRGGRVVEHNPQAMLLLGTDKLLGQPLAAVLPGLEPRWSAWRAAGGRPAVSVDLQPRGRDVRARLLDTGTEDQFTVVFVEDMTRSREQAQQLKLAALGRLTANIAHEIRNPLSAISHASELLAEERRDPDRRRLTRIILDNTVRLEQLVADVLQLNRRDRVSAEHVALDGWLRVFLGEFSANEGVPADRILVEPLRAWIAFDREHLRQVVWNLLRNAVRHAPAEAGAVRLSARAFGDKVEFSITDKGPGVAPSVQGQLFEPFFTTDSKGTGLGLYLARELCAANDASLEYVDGAPGAHFRIICRGGTGA